MAFKLIPMAVFIFTTLVYSLDTEFIFNNGFQSSNLITDGSAHIVAKNRCLTLTDDSATNEMGHAFYPNPIAFKNSKNGTTFSFSTSFVFGITPPPLQITGGQGMAFVVSTERGISSALPAEHLGLFNNSEGSKNQFFAVELDTIKNVFFKDINDNHVGIDINSLVSEMSEPAGYYPDNNLSDFKNLILASNRAMQVWIDYDGGTKQIDVTLAPIKVGIKPRKPLMSLSFDLSPIVNEIMYVGFSAATGTIKTSHYVLGWSFKMNGKSQSLDIKHLPKLPKSESSPRSMLKIVVAVLASSLFLSVVIIIGVIFCMRRRRKFAEVLEDWELEYGPHRFKYKKLYKATDGFSEQRLIGSGGFGKVYKGTLQSSNNTKEIAVKKVASNESGQGMKEFVAEIVTLGRLHHRNIVTLHGYSRRQGEMLLVYDYMPHGSLEKFIYNQPKETLSWSQRFNIVKGVASGLLYLHEEWEQVVIHRDIKASNVLLDGELNARLGDFGLARLYDRGANPQTTNLIGTLGYLAPELMRTGRVSKETDVFAFGAFLLEVVTGKRPFPLEGTDDGFLIDWVSACWERGEILEARDSNFGDEFVGKEIVLVLKLGLMCSQSEPGSRPRMRNVVQYLEGEVPIPEIPARGISSRGALMCEIQQTVTTRKQGISNRKSVGNLLVKPFTKRISNRSSVGDTPAGKFPTEAVGSFQRKTVGKSDRNDLRWAGKFPTDIICWKHLGDVIS